MKNAITFGLTGRERDDLLRAAKKRGVAVATVARRLTLAYFNVWESKRRVSGPRAASTAAKVRRAS